MKKDINLFNECDNHDNHIVQQLRGATEGEKPYYGIRRRGGERPLTQLLEMNFTIVRQCLAKLGEWEAKLAEERGAREAAGRDVLERLNYIQRDIARNGDRLNEHEARLAELRESLGEDFKVRGGRRRTEWRS
jgi:succinate dehydrogenase/fumarate reductase flavoprotein subunit